MIKRILGYIGLIYAFGVALTSMLYLIVNLSSSASEDWGIVCSDFNYYGEGTIELALIWFGVIIFLFMIPNIFKRWVIYDWKKD